jgi:4-diphosphocytidyl-2-C-methyl-D-erythritol kinase
VSGTGGVITVRVPAKINISLGVGPLRPDGFHELDTLFHAVGLFDVITAGAAGALSITVAGPEAEGLPADESNLAWRAAQLLAVHAGIDARAHLHIDKAIPVAAGLAGGSADAAAALVACARLWDVPVSDAELAGLAAQLGSDVPFALLGGTALGSGRGELLRPVQPGPSYHWVLAVADGRLATPAVYREFDRQRQTDGPGAPGPRAEAVLSAFETGDPARLAPCLGNDLEPAALALAPELAATLAAGRHGDALAGIVSGSGPTCVFLTEGADHAARLAADLSASKTCRYAVAVAGGVTGAEVLT